MNLPTKYMIWCKKTAEPDALWAAMPYAKRSKQECEDLVEYYEEAFGSLYIYEVVLCSFTPNGMCEPCFV